MYTLIWFGNCLKFWRGVSNVAKSILIESANIRKGLSQPCKHYGLRTPVWGCHGIPEDV